MLSIVSEGKAWPLSRGRLSLDRRRLKSVDNIRADPLIDFRDAGDTNAVEDAF